ncbi:MAG: hypothetical protein H6Q07_983 [Acidobacteria bacterium]|nr:hypothetical protein [Acidobacteriota bacterium]MBP1622963.1 hypothetical protein [Acidobacteriota bacterium]
MGKKSSLPLSPLSGLQQTIHFLERHWKRLMCHHHVKGLPRTNNMAETFNKQLMRRLKTIEHFQHRTTEANLTPAD